MIDNELFWFQIGLPSVTTLTLNFNDGIGLRKIVFLEYYSCGVTFTTNDPIAMEVSMDNTENMVSPIPTPSLVGSCPL